MLSLLNLRQALRQRLGAAVAAVAASAGCCLCGLVMVFVMAPRQALQAASLQRLPVMDAAAVEAAAPGDTLLVTGVLAGNPPARSGSTLVVYESAVWEVELLESEGGEVGEPSGRWQSQRTQTPALALSVADAAVAVHPAEGVQLGGALREEIVPGTSDLVDDDNGTPRPAGTIRYRGLADGDLVTVLGDKASVGGLTPRHLFAGDRTAFEASQRQAAGNFLAAGIFSLVLAPVVLVGGLLAALLGRRR